MFLEVHGFTNMFVRPAGLDPSNLEFMWSPVGQELVSEQQALESA